MNIPARLEEILADIQADVDFILTYAIGCNNDQALRDKVAEGITTILYSHEETQSAIVLCDENNNPPSLIDAGKLHVDSVFVLNGISFQGIYQVEPAQPYEDSPSIKIEFFIRKVYEEQPKRRIFMVNTGDMPQAKIQKYLEDVMAAYQTKTKYQAMPAALASSLKV